MRTQRLNRVGMSNGDHAPVSSNAILQRVVDRCASRDLLSLPASPACRSPVRWSDYFDRKGARNSASRLLLGRLTRPQPSRSGIRNPRLRLGGPHGGLAIRWRRPLFTPSVSDDVFKSALKNCQDCDDYTIRQRTDQWETIRSVFEITLAALSADRYKNGHISRVDCKPAGQVGPTGGGGWSEAYGGCCGRGPPDGRHPGALHQRIHIAKGE